MKTYEEIAKYHRQALDNLERLNCDGTLDNSKHIKESIMYHQLVAAACEKQVAKKPIHAHGNYYCPVCEDTVLWWDNAITIEPDNSCRICGQKINWSDEK